MSTKKYQLENYRKYLLNRVTSSSHVIEYIESCLAREDEAAPHSFHKVMVHNWTGSEIELFETLSEYFSPTFVPVSYTSQGEIATFYTSSLNLILKITKLDFMFPHQRNMYNVDILFNDKSSADCFGNRVTIENIVASAINSRINDKSELDLSIFCNHPEFTERKIHFYKLNLLTHYKILMLRMGRDTKILKLNNNNLSQVPIEILNFFIKGDLTAIDLSNNNIPSLSGLQRISSKIEKLWIEGNPLCDTIDPVSYVKQIVMKFPRLTELDGIKLNEHGIVIPFFRNYSDKPDKNTKVIVDNFLHLYFGHYDNKPRKKLEMFYNYDVVLTISTNCTEGTLTDHYVNHSRNILNPNHKVFYLFKNKEYNGRKAVVGLLRNFPPTTHDPGTFTVDVLKHDNQSLVLVVDGIFKEYNQIMPERFFQFRRTFIFSTRETNDTLSEYYITNEMFNVNFATEEQIHSSFKDPLRTTNLLALKNPDPDDTEALCNVFSYLSQLKKPEAELRLKIHRWDVIKALKEFSQDFKLNKISPDRFIEDDDFSDSSTLLEDEID